MIVIQNLSKAYQTKHDKVAAVDCVSLEVQAGEIVSLLGPSGCGKTTTLRCVAGLERPDEGRIDINNRTVTKCGDAGPPLFIPPQHRKLGMVFQSYAIWPHMTVFQNVAYALGGRGFIRSDIRKETMKALTLVKLEAYADRPAPRLSGGQQQRVAIARALAGQPEALLFDEPLSNLDAKLRAEMRNEIRRLQRQVGLTSIYVTHDQSEALTIADWIVVMRNGKIIERGRPIQIYRYPKNIFTAHFIGNTNLIPGKVQSKDGSYIHVDSKIGRSGRGYQQRSSDWRRGRSEHSPRRHGYVPDFERFWDKYDYRHNRFFDFRRVSGRGRIESERPTRKMHPDARPCVIHR